MFFLLVMKSSQNHRLNCASAKSPFGWLCSPNTSHLMCIRIRLSSNVQGLEPKLLKPLLQPCLRLQAGSQMDYQRCSNAWLL